MTVPTFHREGSSDRYTHSNKLQSASDNNCITSNLTTKGATASAMDKDTELMNLLRKCEEASRPICFETIDVILRNKDADKIVKELTGMPVNEAYR